MYIRMCIFGGRTRGVIFVHSCGLFVREQFFVFRVCPSGTPCRWEDAECVNQLLL